MKQIFENVWNFLVHLFSAFGLLWVIVGISDFFGSQQFSDDLKTFWWLFGSMGFLYAIYKQLPKSKYEFKVPYRDASIKIVKSDLFNLEGTPIIPVNNLFKINQDGSLLESKSILSQLVKKYFHSKPEHLQTDIDSELKKEFYSNYIIDKIKNEYKVGTVVPIKIQEKKFYFLANTKMNAQNKSFCNDELFEKSINELWVYLSDCAGKEDFVIPLIGTGYGRLSKHREVVFQEILMSFLSSLSSKNYADSLTICIRPSDIKRHNINFTNIGEFALAKIKYQDYSNRNTYGSNEIL